MNRIKLKLSPLNFTLRDVNPATVVDMIFNPGARVYVDESKSGAYYIAAAAAAPGDVAPLEREIRALRHGGRSSIHFNSEGNRRDLLLRRFSEMDVRVSLYMMRGAKDRVARPALLSQLVGDLVTSRASEVIIERDASLEQADRRIIRERLEHLDAIGDLRYSHVGRSDEPLLWIADAVAWCFQAGGQWPKKVAGIVGEVTELNRP